jgi:CCR4-NOT transcription complex subunit 6
MIISGDFNSMPDSGVYELLERGSVPGNHPDLDNYFYGTYSTEGLKHSFALRSVHSTIGEPSFTNYTGDYIGCLDYIWYTDEGLKLCGILQPYEQSQMYSPLPNAHFPSDHISLVAEFELKYRS